MNRRNNGFSIFGMLLLMTLTGLFWSCGMGVDEPQGEAKAVAPREKPWHIYILGSSVGKNKQDNTRRTIKAVEDFLSRSDGKLNYNNVKVIQKLDSDSLEEARGYAREALEDPKHLLTIGHDYSSMTYPIAKMYEGKKLFFTAAATSTQIGDIKGTVFQLCADNHSQAKAIAHYARKETLYPENKKILVLENEFDLYSTNLAEQIEQELTRERKGKKQGTMVERYQYNLRQFEITTLVDEIKKFAPGLIILPEVGQDVAGIVFQLNDAGIHTPILGSDGWGTDRDVARRFKAAIEAKADNRFFYVYSWHQSLSRGDGALASAGSAFTYQGLGALENVISNFEGDVLTEQIQLAERLRVYDENWADVTKGAIQYYALFKDGKVRRPWLLLEIKTDQDADKSLTSEARLIDYWPPK